MLSTLHVMSSQIQCKECNTPRQASRCGTARPQGFNVLLVNGVAASQLATIKTAPLWGGAAQKASVAGLIDEFALGDPGHHGPQLLADLLDLVSVVLRARRLE